MNTEHTPGLLVQDKRGYPHPDIKAVSGRKVANTWGLNSRNPKSKAAYEARVAEGRANARRLVACWNACDGIATDVLEKGSFNSTIMVHLTQAAHSALQAKATESDALLAALTRLSNAAFARDTTMGDQCGLFAAQAELRDATKSARAAITKAGAASS